MGSLVNSSVELESREIFPLLVGTISIVCDVVFGGKKRNKIKSAFTRSYCFHIIFKFIGLNTAFWQSHNSADYVISRKEMEEGEQETQPLMHDQGGAAVLPMFTELCLLLVGIETECTIEKHQDLVSSVNRKIVTVKEGATKQAAQIQRCDQHYKQLIKKAAEFSVETWY